MGFSIIQCVGRGELPLFQIRTYTHTGYEYTLKPCSRRAPSWATRPVGLQGPATWTVLTAAMLCPAVHMLYYIVYVVYRLYCRILQYLISLRRPMISHQNPKLVSRSTNIPGSSMVLDPEFIITTIKGHMKRPGNALAPQSPRNSFIARGWGGSPTQ